MKILVIDNPVAGLNESDELESIENFLEKNSLDYKLYETTKDKGPYEILSNIDNSYETIITCGGDGTVSETIRGMHDYSFESNLLIVPTGTSNEIAQNLGLNEDSLTNVLKRLLKNKVSTLDYGIINDNKTFTYALTFGNFTDVTYKTPQKMKNWLGFQGYILYGFLSFRKIKTYETKIKSKDHNFSGNYLFGAISNSKTIGNVIHYDSDTISLCDGKFEVLLIKKPNNLKEIRLIISGLIQNDYSDKIFTTFKTDELTIKSKNNIDWNTDGELAGSCKDITVKNLHKRINLLV